jgi:DNA modification methylase
VSRTATPEDVLAGRARWCVVEGDALEVVPVLPAGCTDALVTDPPAGIAFMGAEWDHHKGGRAQWVAWLSAVLAAARTATRDGGRALVWSLPRTSHWTGCAVEDAGWSIESKIYHLFGGGFPKGSTQLKPASEEWWLARKGQSTSLNIDGCRVRNGVADAHIQSESSAPNPNGRWPPNAVFSHAPGCVREGTRRVPSDSTNASRGGSAMFGLGSQSGNSGYADPDGTELVESWRCVEGCPVRELDAQSGDLSSQKTRGPTKRRERWGMWGLAKGGDIRRTEYLGESGGASRFFPQFPADPAVFGYVAKPSRAERNAGVSIEERDRPNANGNNRTRYCATCGLTDNGSNDHSACGDAIVNAVAGPQRNDHPTVKSIALMSWLVRLVTGPDALVLDPFGGSGTTGAAALEEGRRVILVERDPRFAEIARQRCEHAAGSVGARQLSLLGGTS